VRIAEFLTGGSDIFAEEMIAVIKLSSMSGKSWKTQTGNAKEFIQKWDSVRHRKSSHFNAIGSKQRSEYWKRKAEIMKREKVVSFRMAGIPFISYRLLLILIADCNFKLNSFRKKEAMIKMSSPLNGT
jgi:hypothetical protein